MNIDNQKFILMCTACVFWVVTWCPNPEDGSHKPQVSCPWQIVTHEFAVAIDAAQQELPLFVALYCYI